MSDTISDFLTVLRNASKAGLETCSVRHSKLHVSVAKILKEEGYIRDYVEGKNERGLPALNLVLKYVDETPAITGITRISTPGRRVYYPAREIPRTLGGLGVSILTTSKGVMKDRDARRQNVGGELLCSVW